jgi:hypothetical protein
VTFVFGFAVGALWVMGWSIVMVRGLRRRLTKAGTVTFQAQARRAQQFNRFCEPCKCIINPHWVPEVLREEMADQNGDGYTQVWHCEPPTATEYRVITESWNADYTERHIYEVARTS